MGKMTLTIFMFEGFLSVILIRLIRPLWPAYNATIGNTTIFGLINLGVWIVILKLWKRVDYKWSTEWCLVYIVKILSGKQSSRLRVKTEAASSEV